MNIRNCLLSTCKEVCFVIAVLSDECTGHIIDLFCKIICKIYLTLFCSSSKKLLSNLLLTSLPLEVKGTSKAAIIYFSQMLSIVNYQFLQNKLF